MRILLLFIGLAVSALCQDLANGLAAYDNADFATALRLLKPLAEGGDAEAQVQLGFMYKLGRGVRADPAEAERWFRRAADQGHVVAKSQLPEHQSTGSSLKPAASSPAKSVPVVQRAPTTPSALDNLLLAAAGRGNLEEVQRLVDGGADVNAKEYYPKGDPPTGNTALINAAEGGRRAVAEFLLAHGADVNSRGRGGTSSLIEASKNGHEDLVELLLARGADLTAVEDDGIKYGHALTRTLEALEDRRMAIPKESLHNIVRRLIQAGAPVNARFEGPRGSMKLPIEIALELHDIALVRMLFYAGATASSDIVGRGLRTAAIYAQADLVDFLLSKSPTSAAKGQALAMAARASGGLETMKVLLEQGANPNYSTAGDRSPLSEAVSYGRLDSIRLLVEKGADLTLECEPLVSAERNGNSEIVAWLKNAGMREIFKTFNGTVTYASRLEATLTNNKMSSWRFTVQIEETATRRIHTFSDLSLEDGAKFGLLRGDPWKEMPLISTYTPIEKGAGVEATVLVLRPDKYVLKSARRLP